MRLVLGGQRERASRRSAVAVRGGMVGRDEARAGLDRGIDDESLARVRLKKSQLEDAAQQVRENIRSSFCRLSDALQSREKQLLRQLEAIHRQQLSLVQSVSEWQPPKEGSVSARLDAEEELLERLVNFGRVEPLDKIAVSDSEPYRPEEYHDDVVHSFDKSLKAESDDFDVSSVIKRRSKPVCINLSCCDSSKPSPPPPQPQSTATRSQERATTSKQEEISPFSPEAVSSSESAPFKEEDSEDENDSTSTASKAESPAVSEEAAEKAFFDNETNNDDSCPEQTDQAQEANKEQQIDVKAQDEHPVQIQQWLQQILAETETEPIIHEIGQIIAKIPNNRLYREFPVET